MKMHPIYDPYMLDSILCDDDFVMYRGDISCTLDPRQI